MEYFNNHTRYIRRCYAFSDISELPEERRPRPHSSVDAFDSPSAVVREPRQQTTTVLFPPRSKNYQVEPADDPESPSFSGIWRRLSSAKSNARSFFSSHNLVQRVLPPVSLDCEPDPVGTDTYCRCQINSGDPIPMNLQILPWSSSTCTG